MCNDVTIINGLFQYCDIRYGGYRRGDAGRERDEEPPPLPGLPRSTEHRHVLRGGAVCSHRIIRLPALRRGRGGLHHRHPGQHSHVSLSPNAGDRSTSATSWTAPKSAEHRHVHRSGTVRNLRLNINDAFS